MSENKRLAVVILTKNEEKHIAACMASAAFADEILVIDSGSTMTDEGFAGQRNFALTQTQADWVLYLDADERITPELAAEIESVIQADKQACYAVKRWNIIFGQKMKHGDHGPDWCLRLFPRMQVRWDGVVHESPLTKLPQLKLAGAMHHYTYTDWVRYFDKFNQYTTLMARRMLDHGKRASFTDILLHPAFAFIRFYILRLGFLDGKQGFIFAVNHYFYTMIKYVKLYYWQRGE